MHFGENELSPSSIGFSPLNLPHLPTFQRRWVRASTVSYHSFTLDRLRSPGFASTPSDYVALFRLGFPSAPYLKYLTLLHTVTRWLVLQKARHHPHMGLWPVVGTRFQVLFHSPPGVLFTFPSRYCFTIGHQVVFSLGRWSSLLPTRFHVSRGTLDQSLIILTFTYRTITSYGPTFQLCSVSYDFSLMLCPQPQR